MSGGVDSSATAALLLDQGYGCSRHHAQALATGCVNRAEDKCCGPQAVTDARSVCHKLGIPYYLIDEAAEFQKHVSNTSRRVQGRTHAEPMRDVQSEF